MIDVAHVALALSFRAGLRPRRPRDGGRTVDGVTASGDTGYVATLAGLDLVTVSRLRVHGSPQPGRGLRRGGWA